MLTSNEHTVSFSAPTEDRTMIANGARLLAAPRRLLLIGGLVGVIGQHTGTCVYSMHPCLPWRQSR